MLKTQKPIHRVVITIKTRITHFYNLLNISYEYINEGILKLGKHLQLQKTNTRINNNNNNKTIQISCLNTTRKKK